MTPNKTTEQPIPQDTKEFAAIKSALGQIFWDFIALSEDGKAIEGNPAVHRMAQWVYEKLHSLPPSPVGEAGGVWDIADSVLKWAERNLAIESGGFMYYEHAHPDCKISVHDAVNRFMGQYRPNPSRAGEISPALPRWVKASDTPKEIGNYYCQVKMDGEEEENHIIEWDGKNWGEVPEYDCYEDLEILVWLEEKKLKNNEL